MKKVARRGWALGVPQKRRWEEMAKKSPVRCVCDTPVLYSPRLISGLLRWIAFGAHTWGSFMFGFYLRLSVTKLYGFLHSYGAHADGAAGPRAGLAVSIDLYTPKIGAHGPLLTMLSRHIR